MEAANLGVYERALETLTRARAALLAAHAPDSELLLNEELIAHAELGIRVATLRIARLG